VVIAYIVGLLALPVLAWKLIPAVDRLSGRPLQTTPQNGVSFGAYYGWTLRVGAVIGTPLVLFFLWVYLLFGVLDSVI
jgi:hypothetical protein